ncbi:DUF1508 domain-containing protein [Candidatus Viadribacter manganicus]|uniref:DUF1508 domain-containing protein n=1 Tax=Candidatus Viadribacter manganicus TaxID=1759059 RepID=A0A1B1AKP9_9PROT|nr:DUF1508 domain-containing protein [Candidatus Viadribacter manganicus]ANP47121.1 hypothetical protein ATE48_14940 [Candidatus Viadribacter manganicus]
MYFYVYREQSPRRDYRWTLYAANGRKIANSGEGFVARAGCYRSMQLLIGLDNIPIRHSTNAAGQRA